MIVAMATAIGFATRGAMAGNREIIEVLHFVGAADAYIARQFQGHFLRLGLKGAAIGGAAAALFFAVAALVSTWRSRSTGGEEIAALFGAFALGLVGYAAIVGDLPRHRRADRRSVARNRLPPTAEPAMSERDAGPFRLTSPDGSP